MPLVHGLETGVTDPLLTGGKEEQTGSKGQLRMPDSSNAGWMAMPCAEAGKVRSRRQGLFPGVFTLRRPADIGAEPPRRQVDEWTQIPDSSEDWRFRFPSPWHPNCVEAFSLDKITQGNGWLGRKGRLRDMATFSRHGEEENSQETLRRCGRWGRGESRRAHGHGAREEKAFQEGGRVGCCGGTVGSGPGSVLRARLRRLLCRVCPKSGNGERRALRISETLQRRASFSAERASA